jgi:hypothetical protein
MKHVKTLAMLFLGGMVALTACKKDAKTSEEEISQAVKDQIYSIGFGTSDIQKVDEGYLVEGDIILTPEYLNSNPTRLVLRAGTEEQYHTTNLVTGVPRTIRIALNSKLAAKPGYSQALTEVAARYNAVSNFTLTFTVVSSGADITYVEGHGQYLASAGFPSNTGQPYGTVKVNAQFIGTGTSTKFIDYLATIMAHEAGHCIGFRHSDFFDRSISCGGSAVNEGASTVGAIWIPGTPEKPDVDTGSWMLSCISSGQNRDFTNYDKTALSYLY